MGVKVEENPVDILNRADIAIPTVASRIPDGDKEDDSANEINAKVLLLQKPS